MKQSPSNDPRLLSPEVGEQGKLISIHGSAGMLRRNSKCQLTVSWNIRKLQRKSKKSKVPPSTEIGSFPLAEEGARDWRPGSWTLVSCLFIKILIALARCLIYVYERINQNVFRSNSFRVQGLMRSAGPFLTTI